MTSRANHEFVYHGTSISADDLDLLEEWFTGGMPGRSVDGVTSNVPTSIAGLVYLTAHAGAKYAFENARGACALVMEFRLADLVSPESALLAFPDEDYLQGLWERRDPQLTAEHRLADGRFNPRDYRDLWIDSLTLYGSFAIDGPLPVRLASRIAMFDRTLNAGAWLDTCGALNLNLGTASKLAPFFAASTALIFDGTPMRDDAFGVINAGGNLYGEGAREAFCKDWEAAVSARHNEHVLVRPVNGWVPSDIVAAVVRAGFVQPPKPDV